MRCPALRRLMILSGLLLLQVPVWGQWVTQQIQLQPGWNAVYMEVQPEPRECDALFAGLPVERVWGWNRRFVPIQLLANANELAPPDWLMWLPPGHELSSQVNLFTLEAGKTYLIKLPDSGIARTWAVKGMPRLRHPEWLSDSLNLVGFTVSRSLPPTFQQFFGSSLAHSAGPFFRLGSNGDWARVSNPSTVRMRSGEGFWAYCRGQSEYAGPVELRAEKRTGLEYGRELGEQDLRIRNASSSSKVFRVRWVSSDEPPGGAPAYAGEVPLSYWKADAGQGVPGWVPLPGQLDNLTVGAGDELKLRLAVRRADMARYVPVGGVSEFHYQGLLEVTETGGLLRVMVPVSAEGLQGKEAATAQRDPRAGLWVGTATIDHVSQLGTLPEGMPLPVGSPLRMRLIVHIDDQGTVKLLQKAVLLWKPGTFKADPANPGNQVPDQPGEYLLLGDERRVALQLARGYTGSGLRDGQPVIRRISSAAFGFREPIVMEPGVGLDSQPYFCTVVMDYRDPLNPFLHRYNPNHDNLANPDFSSELHSGVESLTITRRITLGFSLASLHGDQSPSIGDSQLRGAYIELLSGAHKSSLKTSGKFVLYRASDNADLR